MTFSRYGGPEVLSVSDVPMVQPKAGEVVVRVTAASVNGGEVAGRRGDLKLVTGRRFPQRTGIDFVGFVTATGPDAAYAPIGTRVWGTVDERGRQGSLAEFISVEPSRFSVAPKHLTDEEAATLLAGGTTALRGLRDVARLQPGERLLVRGASGGVGSVAVQVGKHLGAHVTGSAHPDAFEFVTQQGADAVVDYSVAPSELGAYDVIFDTRGTHLGEFRRQLVPGGRMVAIAFDLGRPVRSLAYLQVARLFRKRRLSLFLGHPDRALFEELATLVDDDVLRPVLHDAFEMKDVAAAHARLERARVRGKVVVRVPGDE